MKKHMKSEVGVVRHDIERLIDRCVGQKTTQAIPFAWQLRVVGDQIAAGSGGEEPRSDREEEE